MLAIMRNQKIMKYLFHDFYNGFMFMFRILTFIICCVA